MENVYERYIVPFIQNTFLDAFEMFSPLLVNMALLLLAALAVVGIIKFRRRKLKVASLVVLLVIVIISVI